MNSRYKLHLKPHEPRLGYFALKCTLLADTYATECSSQALLKPTWFMNLTISRNNNRIAAVLTEPVRHKLS